MEVFNFDRLVITAPLLFLQENSHNSVEKIAVIELCAIISVEELLKYSYLGGFHDLDK